MLTVYKSNMPFRLLEEIRLWKMQEKDHANIVLKSSPELPPAFTSLMKEWENVFTKTQDAAHQWIETLLSQEEHAESTQMNQIHHLAHTSANQTEEWIQQLYRMLNQIQLFTEQTARRVLVMHIIRVSEYYLGVMKTWLQANNNWTEKELVDAYDDEPAHSMRADDMFDPSTSSVPIGGHRLPPLPYAYDALEPYIDTETMRLHHDKHHQSYVDGLNQAEKMMQQAREKNNFDLIKHWEREAAFHGAGHYLHTIFWNIMSPQGGGPATGAIAKQIERDFGSYASFKEHFSQAAQAVEGGGWAILVWSPRSHRLEILQAEKHQNLSQWDVIPLLVLDVWEHAYYLKHQNDRKAYIKDWWNTVNWKHVNDRFTEARRVKWLAY